MTPTSLRRAGARAAVAAAVVGIPADLFHFTMASRAAASQSLAFRLHGIALVLALTLLLVVAAVARAAVAIPNEQPIRAAPAPAEPHLREPKLDAAALTVAGEEGSQRRRWAHPDTSARPVLARLEGVSPRR